MALPSLANLSKGQKALGIGIVAITGLALTGQGKNLKSKKKKLPSGGKADYMKSLGGGGGGGGGGGSRGSSSPSKQTSPTPEDSTQEPLTPDPSLLDFLNYNVPEEEQISTQEEALGQLEQLQEQNPNAIIEYDEQDGLTLDLFPNWDGPTWFNPATAAGSTDNLNIDPISEGTSPFWSGDWDYAETLQQNIADGTAFSWLNDDSTEDDTVVEEDATEELEGATTNQETQISGCTDPASHSYNPDATVDDGSCLYYTGRAEENVFEATDNWLQNYVKVENIELEETDTPPLDPALANAFRSNSKKHIPQSFNLYH